MCLNVNITFNDSLDLLYKSLSSVSWNGFMSSADSIFSCYDFQKVVIENFPIRRSEEL